ncbi:hypothetical protein TRFO_10288 [Tritrichomonas foetus]|uniref:VWFA domain-containing protein n=1 Tax=Tritrichomonas foetus TaxID=1144522 RepID=A0A1J4JEL2_9EUKA|nr:hypothetical protein TRFO_10288 [Tritrichomonas foetus]|eukprot:OHS95877.1 hypothetical protein TRFO_10288 [Tritrichomonas foetus]
MLAAVCDKSGKLAKLSTVIIEGFCHHSFCSLTSRQKFRITENSQDLSVLLHAGCDYIVYDIKIFKGDKELVFNLIDLDESETDNDQLVVDDSDSTDTIKLDIGKAKEGTIIEVKYSCSFKAILSEPSKIRYLFPYTGKNSNCLLKLSLTYSDFEDPIEVSSNLTTVKKSGDQITCEDFLKTQLYIDFTFTSVYESRVILSSNSNKNYLGFSMNPQINDEVLSEVYLVVDCSGSMAGTTIEVAKQALFSFIDQIPGTSYFNIIRFGSQFETMFEKSVPATEENFNYAREKSSVMKANLGGTDILSPLHHIFHIPKMPGYVRQVFLLTDGNVQESSEVIAKATQHRNNHRLFSIGIGNGVSKDFIIEVAKCSNGRSAFVHHVSEELPNIINDQIKSAMKPAVIDTQLHIEGCESFEIAPYPIPTLFKESLSSFYCKCDEIDEDNVDVLLTGSKGFQDSYEPIKVDGIRLDKFFAFFNIRDMEEKIQIANLDDVQELKNKTIQISHDHGIVSQFTVFSRTKNSQGTFRRESSTNTPDKQRCDASARRNVSMRQYSKMNSLQMKNSGIVPEITQNNEWGQSNNNPRNNARNNSRINQFNSPQKDQNHSNRHQQSSCNKISFFNRCKNFNSTYIPHMDINQEPSLDRSTQQQKFRTDSSVCIFPINDGITKEKIEEIIASTKCIYPHWIIKYCVDQSKEEKTQSMYLIAAECNSTLIDAFNSPEICKQCIKSSVQPMEINGNKPTLYLGTTLSDEAIRELVSQLDSKAVIKKHSFVYEISLKPHAFNFLRHFIANLMPYIILCYSPTFIPILKISNLPDDLPSEFMEYAIHQVRPSMKILGVEMKENYCYILLDHAKPSDMHQIIEKLRTGKISGNFMHVEQCYT